MAGESACGANGELPEKVFTSCATNLVDAPVLGIGDVYLRDLAQQRLRDFRKATGGALPLIGVGGIASAEDAWARIRAGASLVQLYSAMVYEGPGIARSIARGLEALMARDGFASIAEAVGTE